MVKQATAKRAVPGRRAKKKGAKRPDLGTRLLGHGQRLMWLAVEGVALAWVALLAVIVVLGRATAGVAGGGLWAHLLPFAGVVLLLAGLIYLAFRSWLVIRNPAPLQAPALPVLLACSLAVGVGWFAVGDRFGQDLGQLRSLVGGVRQAEITTLAHQVYASYRRTDLVQMQTILERARPYEVVIAEAASRYRVDPEVMIGLGAVESSFLPRDSKDGGRGLYQITAPPPLVLAEVGGSLGSKALDWRDSRHNALLAAATWRHYLTEMNNDLFLGLLAYNIGPKNGGLLSIMRQYGAKDFVTIQPYLQNLPRDYPIRVLTAALACRLFRVLGQLPRYEEGDNAKQIQAIGIPGLSGLRQDG